MRYVILCACVLLILAAGDAAAEWQGSVETIEGVTHVYNPETPAEGAESLEMEPLWSVGGESEEDEEIFGLVQQILVDEDGNTYLLDQQLAEIRVFDAEGEYLTSLGREGEGPGEFRNPMAMFFLPDGRIGVVQMMPGRIAVLDREGEGYEDFPLPGAGGFSFVQDVYPCGGNIAVKMMSGSFADGKARNTLQVLILDAEGNEVRLIGEEVKEYETGGAMRIEIGGEAFARAWTTDQLGRVYVVSDLNDYNIAVYGVDGDLERIIHREYEPLPVSKEELERLQKDWDEQGAGQGIGESPTFPDTQPDIESLFVRPNGEVWVRTSRTQDEDESGLGLFDVFDAEGRFVRQVRPVLDYDFGQDGFVVQGEYLYRIKEQMGAMKAWAASFGGGMRIQIGGPDDDEDDGEPEPLEIQAYRLPTVLDI